MGDYRMKKHTLLLLVMILVLALGTLKSVTAENVENITFYLDITNAQLIKNAWHDGSPSFYSGIRLEISPQSRHAEAEWTFTLPENCTEITGIKMHLRINAGNTTPLEIYLNDIPIGNVTGTGGESIYDVEGFADYCFYTGNVTDMSDCDNKIKIDESVLEKINEKIKNAKTLTLRVEMNGNLGSRAFIACYSSNSNYNQRPSYIYVEYRPGSTASVPTSTASVSTSTAPVPTLAVVFGALIITALLLRRA